MSNKYSAIIKVIYEISFEDRGDLNLIDQAFENAQSFLNGEPLDITVIEVFKEPEVVM